VYEHCVPAIIDKSALATVSFSVLGYFLRAGMPPAEAQQLLSKLSIADLVAELRCYIQIAATHGPRELHTRDYDLRGRIGVMMLLMSKAPEEQVTAARDEVYQLLFGDDAADNFARHIGWQELESLNILQRQVFAAKKLM
ncbi:hypothetical protein LTS01_025920, partial [Friedmanniomyces endolithicus]